ncbi:MAG: hypothetical protein ACI95X_002629 [Paraglaciecola sp.]|jgi:hypothetical protein
MISIVRYRAFGLIRYHKVRGEEELEGEAFSAVYSIHIDGDAIEDMTFQFRFESMLPNNNEGVALMIGPADNQRSVEVSLKNIGGITAANQANANFSESYSLVIGPQSSGSSAQLTNSRFGTTSFGKPLDYIGNKTFTNGATYAEYSDSFIYDFAIPGCDSMGKVFVGQRKDAFVINLGKTF